MTYAVPLKVTIRLVVWNKDPETGVKTIRDIKEQEVYFGDIPLMTENGTFIINGTERVIVSQLHRSPGAFFHEDRAEKEFVGQIIPYRGSWVEFKYDAKNLLYVSVDRKRKFLASVFLRALGLRGADEIIRQFYTVHRLFLGGNTVQWAVSDAIVGLRSRREVKIPGADITIGEGKKITVAAVAALRKAGVDRIDIIDEARAGAFAAADLVDPSTGEVLLEANDELTERVISMAQEKAIEYVDVFFPEADEVGAGGLGDAEEGRDQDPRGSARGDLSAAAARRSTHPRQQPVALREHVLQPAEVRLLAGRAPEAQHEAEAQHAARREDPAPAGLLRGHQVPPQAAQEPDERGRHRSPRQPPGAVGGRAAREPVPDRPGPDGAGDQGEDVGLPGNGDRHAARPDQREAGHGRDSRVLRVVAAVAVHGPDQPAVGDHAQAAAVGPRARRSLARARRLRGARRAPDALRPHLPD